MAWWFLKARCGIWINANVLLKALPYFYKKNWFCGFDRWFWKEKIVKLYLTKYILPNFNLYTSQVYAF